MTKPAVVCASLMLSVCTLCEAQNKISPPNEIAYQTKEVIISSVPGTITRNIIQDRKGNIWIAAFDGIFRYDGKSFANITSKVSSARFFSVLEDRKGNFWFGTIGSGVFYYDGVSFRHFTMKEGLPDDRVPYIYEDKTGNIWFGTTNGASRYDGKSFYNYRMDGEVASVNDNNDVNAIIEDKSGKFWFGTRGKLYRYDGKKFAVVNHNGQSLRNVRKIMEDKQGQVWLGGSDGLWRYNGVTFTNITEDFVGYIFQDRNGNIWTSSQVARNPDGRWALSRYDVRSLYEKNPAVAQMKSQYENNKGMIFGILEASDRNLWYGGLDGVHRYDSNTVTQTHYRVPDAR
jgi:ligand-binding sensor domain-containing protein